MTPAESELLSLGVKHQMSGRLRQAEELYREVLATSPEHPDALHMLGTVAHQAGRTDAAAELFERVLRARPSADATWLALAMARHALKQPEAAAIAFERVGQLASDISRIRLAARGLVALGKLDQAVTALGRGVALDARNADARAELGEALRLSNHWEAAAAEYRAALVLNPSQLHANRGLGYLLVAGDQGAEAEPYIQTALRLAPNDWNLWNLLAGALQFQNRPDEALAAYEKALAHVPNGDEEARVRNDMSRLRILLGDFERGWEEFEWRLRTPEGRTPFDFPRPEWTGQDLSGKTILLHPERSAHGDVIHFVRYAALVAARGARVVLHCQPALTLLMRSAPGVGQVVTHGEALPYFDYHAALMSLPRVFKTTVATIPASIPYLEPPPALLSQWRARFEGNQSFKIGLVWAGSARPFERRSRTLASFAPLAGIPGVTFYGLQPGPADSNLLPAGMTFLHLGAEINDFADTAAAIAQMDMVISVDTAAAHLAGAMGKPVWTLIDFAPGFLWMLDRSDTPWYPTMRLFRQARAGDWPEVFVRIRAALEEAAAKAIQETSR